MRMFHGERGRGPAGAGRGRRLGLLGAAGAVICLGLVGAAPGAAATVTVNCTGGDNLQTAIDNAASGDTLQIQGTCTGSFVIIGKDLSLVGTGTHPTLDGGGTGRPLTTGSTTTTLQGLTITGGSATGGGGLQVGGLTNVTVLSSTISGNQSLDHGGGIFAVAGGHVTVENSTVSGNTAPQGGGIMAYNGCDGDRAIVTNSTITGNSAATVGGIWVGGCDSGSTLTSSILAGNYSGLIEFNVGGTIHSGGYNVVGNNYSGSFLSLPTDVEGVYPASVDPMLDALADNGGPTYTEALLPGSPALNLNTACAGGTDQRGVSRPAGHCDAGAYQSSAFCQPGFYSTTGVTPCTAADPGHYVDVTGATEQTDCALGTYQPNAGASSCMAASVDHYVGTAGATAQSGCPIGTYQPNTGQSSCITASLLSSDKTTCNGVYTGTGKDVVVPKGATCRLLPGTRVSHDVKMEEGGTLMMRGTWVGHDVSADKATAVTICGSQVDHDLSVKKSSGDVAVGGDGCGNTIGDDLKVEENGGAVNVSGNTVGHDLSVQKNTPGPVAVSNNQAGHDATCKSNSSQSGSGNTAPGKNSCPV
jgi:Tyrosine-protein kinase ephrin type A/B receptor-like